ncbi:hypothetical protein WMY93_012087 [Mugilogobius chulae]|uniref:Uncharacterized protein n=1 Tax=Mugilogobius chulae TaxID=88201 RepID=A0AAW0PA63_9GOBI
MLLRRAFRELGQKPIYGVVLGLDHKNHPFISTEVDLPWQPTADMDIPLDIGDMQKRERCWMSEVCSLNIISTEGQPMIGPDGVDIGGITLRGQRFFLSGFRPVAMSLLAVGTTGGDQASALSSPVGMTHVTQSFPAKFEYTGINEKKSDGGLPSRADDCLGACTQTCYRGAWDSDYQPRDPRDRRTARLSCMDQWSFGQCHMMMSQDYEMPSPLVEQPEPEENQSSGEDSNTADEEYENKGPLQVIIRERRLTPVPLMDTVLFIPYPTSSGLDQLTAIAEGRPMLGYEDLDPADDPSKATDIMTAQELRAEAPELCSLLDTVSTREADRSAAVEELFPNSGAVPLVPLPTCVRDDIDWDRFAGPVIAMEDDDEFWKDLGLSQPKPAPSVLNAVGISDPGPPEEPGISASVSTMSTTLKRVRLHSEDEAPPPKWARGMEEPLHTPEPPPSESGAPVETDEEEEEPLFFDFTTPEFPPTGSHLGGLSWGDFQDWHDREMGNENAENIDTDGLPIVASEEPSEGDRRPSGGGHGQPGDIVSPVDLTGPLGCPRLGTAANKTPLTKMEVIVETSQTNPSLSARCGAGSRLYLIRLSDCYICHVSAQCSSEAHSPSLVRHGIGSAQVCQVCKLLKWISERTGFVDLGLILQPFAFLPAACAPVALTQRGTNLLSPPPLFRSPRSAG